MNEINQNLTEMEKEWRGLTKPQLVERLSAAHRYFYDETAAGQRMLRAKEKEAAANDVRAILAEQRSDALRATIAGLEKQLSRALGYIDAITEPKRQPPPVATATPQQLGPQIDQSQPSSGHDYMSGAYQGAREKAWWE